MANGTHASVEAGAILVAIIHGSAVVGAGIANLLNLQPDIHVVTTFDGAREALARPLAGEHILLYDLQTARRDGQALVVALRRQVSNGKILVFGVADDVQSIIECVRAGASSCILEDVPLDGLIDGIRALAQGVSLASPRVVTTLFNYVARMRAEDDQLLFSRLTLREEEVLELMAEGLTNKEIARRLHLQPQTVKNYSHLVLQKLNFRSRFELVRAARNGARLPYALTARA